ncbi:hypothetical protein BDN70DRAFT_855397 [Pholiota conissans]|uniref:DUF6697 domain-containing protein n=1 Tax=Pholiota conissans TaxID=109636 RepID=A0A9P5Z5R4_9AGAR|nr:hypothetical protein BDN70DRAFT_855397 [Pholiota conissans]
MSNFAASLDEKRYSFMTPLDDLNQTDELAKLKMELAVLKNANPFLIAEIALELQMERMRVEEAMKARDSALDRLCDAYASIRQKNEIIEHMQEERESNGATPFPTYLIRVKDTVEIDKLKAHIVALEATVEELRAVVSKPTDPPPCYEENAQKKAMVDIETQTVDSALVNNALEIVSGESTYIPPQSDDVKEMVNARNAVLAEIPLPDNPPDATLTAIVFPPPVTLHEFLNLAPAALKTALSSYRILQNHTTTWCPDREEHGFMYVPTFKCSTNPKVATAHRWSAVDPIGRMIKPTECFYHKEGIWYYAGSYKAFKMDILTTKEWSQLPAETTSAIIRETIAARKNSSPQNTYETSQLYASGALKVACIGLQCVGFSQDIYKAILEHSAKLNETKWKSLIVAPPSGSNPTTPTSVGTALTANVPKPAPTKVPGVPRNVQRIVGSGSIVSAVGSPNTSQGPPTVSQLSGAPMANAGVGNGISMAPLLLGSGNPNMNKSIWAPNAAIGSSQVVTNTAAGKTAGAASGGPLLGASASPTRNVFGGDAIVVMNQNAAAIVL